MQPTESFWASAQGTLHSPVGYLEAFNMPSVQRVQDLHSNVHMLNKDQRAELEKADLSLIYSASSSCLHRLEKERHNIASAWRFTECAGADVLKFYVSKIGNNSRASFISRKEPLVSWIGEEDIYMIDKNRRDRSIDWLPHMLQLKMLHKVPGYSDSVGRSPRKIRRGYFKTIILSPCDYLPFTVYAPLMAVEGTW